MPHLPDLTPHLRAGDTLVWGQSHAEPRGLIEALISQRHRIGRMRIFLGIGLSGQLRPEHADAFDFIGYCGSGTHRALSAAGALDILPAHYSHLPHLIGSGALRIDAVLLQVSPPDAQGRHSLGLAREYLVAALAQARTVIAEVHPDVPWTAGGPYLRRADCALMVDATHPLPGAEPARPGPAETAIGTHVAAFIEDGATLQTGIGAIPDAVTAALNDRRDLGLHTGSLGDGMAALCLSGAVTNARKSIDRGIGIGSVLIGGEAVRRFAHRNPGFEMRGTEYTHAPGVLGRIERFVAINSAIEVDLTGQINSETAGGHYLGAVGGIVDFLRAAGASPGGVPIVALPSTSRGHSRIVAALSGPVSVARSDAGVIVTEYGAADLRGLTLSQRVPRMIAIAHPDHREGLERAARAAGWRG